MSVNVLVIPEDFRKDQYVLKPLVERLMQDVVSKPRVRVCCDPLLGGVDQATRWDRIQEIVDRYRGMTKVFLLIVDRDGEPDRTKALAGLESRAAALLEGTAAVFLAENAWQEVEVWILAGMTDLPKDWKWADIRAERDPKESYFEPYVRLRGLQDILQSGRDVLAREAAARYKRVRQLCPEDLGRLEGRLRDALGELSV
ncbi:MAG: hypothetical protein JNK45_19555 [Myxococcales bacterium]|nr:hypothetical protein [Myxococcales bacterium]